MRPECLLHRRSRCHPEAEGATAAGKDPKAMAKKTKMKEVVQKQKDKVKTLRKEVAGIEKAIHTVNRMEEKLQGKKQQLAKCETVLLTDPPLPLPMRLYGPQPYTHRRRADVHV